MKHGLLYRNLALLIFSFIFSSVNWHCIREINFNKPDDFKDPLVVNGAFTDGPGPHRLYLSRPAAYNLLYQDGLSGASATLSDDLGNQYVYEEIQSADGKQNYYELKGVSGVSGRSYSLHIRLADGSEYRVDPQVLPQKIPLDSLFVGIKKDEFTAANGAVVNRPVVSVYAAVSTPLVTDNRYIRWESTGVYIFDEILPKPYNFFNPWVAKQCFIKTGVSNGDVFIANPDLYTGGALITETVGGHRFDNTFQTRFCFSVVQYTIGKTAFKYWENVKKTATQNGSIFDAPAAPLAGNVYRADNSGEQVFGFFEVAGYDVRRIYKNKDDFAPDFTLPQVPYCQLLWDVWPPVNHQECDDCLLLPNSSLEKPEWWE